MMQLSVFLLSLSTITFEILLARIFSISQWNHLSFMVISIALFGFAAGGAVLIIIESPSGIPIQRLSSPESISLCIILYTVSVIISLLTLNRIPLDYFRLTLETVQIFYLLLSYVIVSLPFFFAGFVIAIAYASVPQRSGIVYFVSMAGSALGAVVPALLLPLWGEGRLVVAAGLAPFFSVIFTVRKLFGHTPASFPAKFALAASGFCVFSAAVFLLTPPGNLFVEPRPSPYKALSQTLQFPDARVTATLAGLHGRIDHVESRHIRFAPGLSLKFSGLLPRQSALFRDGDSPFVLYHLNSGKDAAFVKNTLAYAGYELNPGNKKVLVIQNDGGLGIIGAIASGSREITVVEPDPNMACFVRKHYHLPVVNQDHRAFLAQSRQRFGIIHIENWGSSLPGTTALNQEHFFTIDAMTNYLRHLTENGVIVAARKLLLPPSDVLRLWAAAYESLRSNGAETPARHLAVLRSWDAIVLIISARPFTDTKPIENFALNKNFDLVYLPGIQEKMTNRFNVFEQPYHYIEIKHLAEAYQAGTEKLFFAAYPLDIAPQTDQRPFQSSFLKWTRLKDFYKSTGSRFDALFLSGEMVVAVVLLEALGVTLILLSLPRILALYGKHAPSPLESLYFALIGAGFMFVEIYCIKKFVFLFGNPFISLTVVLSAVLVFSGLGGYYSRNMDLKTLKSGLGALLLVLLGLSLSMNRLAESILPAPGFWRYLLAVLLLLPPGFLMGLPFPVGMRLLLNSPYQRANAWALNGCTSVLATILAVQIALGRGIPAVLICAVPAYLCAYLIMVLRFK